MSIKKFFLINFFLGLATITVIISLFSLYKIDSANKEDFQQSIRQATRNINYMISNLNSINLIVSENQSMEYDDQLAPYLEGYRENYLAYSLITAAYETGTDFKALELLPEYFLEKRNTYRECVDILANHSRKINDLLEERNSQSERSTDAIITFILFLGIFIFFLVTILYMFFRSFSGNIENMVGHVKALVEGNEFKLQIKSHCTEERQILNKLDELEKKLMFQQQLLKSTDFGTLEDILPEMYPLLKKQLPIERLGVAFMDSSGNVVAETVVSDENNLLLTAGFSERIEQTTLGSISCTGDPRIINDIEYHFENVHKSSSTLMILEEGFKSSITVPICTENSLLGFLFISSRKKYAFDQNDAKIAKQFVNTIKSEIYNSYLLQEIVAKTAKTFADLVEKKDFETGNHLIRVASYSQFLAKELSKSNPAITPKLIREIYWFAPLHDIGKVGIPDSILLKPGKLTDDEFIIMKGHVNIGIQVLENMNNILKGRINLDLLGTALDIIAGHHEKWDGSGYPYGLKGEEISLAGRIVAIADVFDALMSERSYKKAFSFEDSIEIIKKGRGSHFCPTVTDLFLRHKDEMLAIRRKYDD